MDNKQGKALIDKSTSDGNQKGENANEEGMYGYVRMKKIMISWQMLMVSVEICLSIVEC